MSKVRGARSSGEMGVGHRGGEEGFLGQEMGSELERAITKEDQQGHTRGRGAGDNIAESLIQKEVNGLRVW